MTTAQQAKELIAGNGYDPDKVYAYYVESVRRDPHQLGDDWLDDEDNAWSVVATYMLGIQAHGERRLLATCRKPEHGA